MKVKIEYLARLLSRIEARIVPFLIILSVINTSVVFSQDQLNDKTCIDCHKRTVKNDIIHGPTATDCTICHIPNGKEHPMEDVEGFTFLETGAALCYSCHEDAGKSFTTDKYIHKPVKNGECSECHEVHSSDNKKFLFATPPDLCFFCHNKMEDKLVESSVVHSPAMENGGCIQCHSPHSSPNKKMLISKEKTLCLSCHDKKISKGKREIANINKIIESSQFKHPALENGCSVCHDPHASNNEYLLKSAYPLTNYALGVEENFELCFGCHDADLLLLEKTKYATGFRDGERNLHFVHVNREKGRTCKNCHSIHGSSRNHLVPETVKFGNWDMPLNYLDSENGGTCLSGCHKERSYTR